ncbi:hypothetical protein LJ207_06315 [Halanaerobium sp. Z-7514]|uniref:Uncharacterized protein n=1 Tax=Halanaerobium polyolivorans TaxID=2886943 RepID=A0AAW4X048_9FIRM|nr:hypothetical protein [Halanaerobium polyolivorans]MCC3144931.1 hypothetical protein [Halanaerobium polyolivorans]RQD73586.1 MAG: hypothetical protein D5S01_07670 [Halanaerobium sp. MSAO_Bac5]
MKKALILILVFLLAFTFTAAAEDAEQLDQSLEENMENLDLSQERGFSEEGREELIGIASQFDSQTGIDNIEINSQAFNLTGNGVEEVPGMRLLSDLFINADYSQQMVDDKLETETDLQLEYFINSRSLIRAGYSLANREWWERQNTTDLENMDFSQNSANSRSTETVFREESEVSRNIGLAYRTSDQLTVSADYIENTDFRDYTGNLDYYGDSTVFGLQYDNPLGTIRASYQMNLSDQLTQRITGVELEFNNLATFSASYKLLDPEELESALNSQTAWDLGLGFNINESYGLSLGYEIIESEDEEDERNISASFEFKF